MLNDIKSDFAPSDRKKSTPLPAGDYVCQIDTVKYDEYNGDKNLSVTLKVVEGEHEGRLIFHSFWMWSGSEKAQSFHRSKYHEFLFSVGYCAPHALKALSKQGYKSAESIRAPEDLQRVKAPMICVMKHDEYKKKVVPKWFNPKKKVDVSDVAAAEPQKEEYATESKDFGAGSEDLPF